MPNQLPTRQEMIERQKNEEFDLVIIGGGATGVGTARDAILRGLSVALVEKGDFSSGTSSQSTKLLHGGLRYLKNFEFGLVREAALERMNNLEIAPHLGEIKDFLVPLYTWSEDRPILLRFGLWVYSALSFPKNLGRHKWLNKAQLEEREPLLKNDTLKCGGLYQDVQTHDSRLVIANALSAIEHGAVLTNYTYANQWVHGEDGFTVDVTDQETDEQYQIRGKVLINATGPWTEIVEDRIKNFNGEAKLRPTWGAHLMLKKKTSGYPVLIVNDDGRALFLIPHDDYDLAGTTDIDYHGDPDDIAPTEYDQEYILNAINKLFPSAKYDEDDVVAAFSGLRPLVYQSGVAEGKVSRNHEIFVEDGVITVTGGKLTTYRVMAKETVDHALTLLGLSRRNYRCITQKVNLYGGDVDREEWPEYYEQTSEQLIQDYNIDKKAAKNLVKHYGSDIDYVRSLLEEHGQAKFKEHRPWMEIQVLYACRKEMARTPVDFLRRRTWIMLEENNGEDILDRVIELMADELSWDDEMCVEMREKTIDYINRYIRIQPTVEIVGEEDIDDLPPIPTTERKK